jgi:hypothetical protein
MITQEQKQEMIRIKSEKFKKTSEEKEALKKAMSEWKKSQVKNGTKA